MTNEDKPTTEDRLDALARRYREAMDVGGWQLYVDETLLRPRDPQPGADSMYRAGNDTGDIW